MSRAGPRRSSTIDDVFQMTARRVSQLPYNVVKAGVVLAGHSDRAAAERAARNMGAEVIENRKPQPQEAR